MEQGKKILINAYWSSKGWKKFDLTDENFSIAKQQGYMFDYPEYISHKEFMIKLHNIVGMITPEQAANAFLYSLSTRKLEYRSVLGSYWYASAVPEHTFDENSHHLCPVCYWYGFEKNPGKNENIHGMNYNVFNFERYKWGGVRHCMAEYALFDLEQFLKLPEVKHTPEDEKILSDILDCVKDLQPKNKSGSLQKLITQRKIIKSNKQEIDSLLDILGICGVLSSEENPCYSEEFRGVYDRNPPENTNDREYPLNWWRASNGINRKRYEIVFEKSLELK